jgi:hypothetical protein
VKRVSRKRYLEKIKLLLSSCSKWSEVWSPDLWKSSFHFPLQFSSGLLETITGISSKACPSAPLGRARLCLCCGIWWHHTAYMFYVRAGITFVMTGTGRLTGAQEIIQVTWQMWLSLMEVSCWEMCPKSRQGIQNPGPVHVVVWPEQVWFGCLFLLMCCFGFDWLGMPFGGVCILSWEIIVPLTHPSSLLYYMHGLHTFTCLV